MSVNLPKTLSDHPSLVGIIRLPGDCYGYTQKIEIPIITNDSGTWKNLKQPVDVSTTINSVAAASNEYIVPKAKLTDMFPYTYYVLTDGECDPLILHPQFMPNKVMIKGTVALSHQPVERYYIGGTDGQGTIQGYKGDVGGHNYNITNLNQMMLPTATNEGIGYMSANANTIMQNRKSQVTSNVLNAVSGIATSIGAGVTMGVGAGVAMGANTVKNMITGINDIKNADARTKDMTLTPNSISSYGTPSTRDKFDNNKVRLLKYTIQDKYKNKINNYVNRFGHKYNNYDTIDIKTYKGYIKYLMPNVDGNIDNMYMSKIISILERGIYIE
ncbi:MAG: hypothetical protein ACRCXT_21090 [Paraclostridium sp.]